MTYGLVDPDGQLDDHGTKTATAAEVILQALRRDLAGYPADAALDGLTTVWINIAFGCGHHELVRQTATDISRNFAKYVREWSAAGPRPTGRA